MKEHELAAIQARLAQEQQDAIEKEVLEDLDKGITLWAMHEKYQCHTDMCRDYAEELGARKMYDSKRRCFYWRFTGPALVAALATPSTLAALREHTGLTFDELRKALAYLGAKKMQDKIHGHDLSYIEVRP